MRFRLTGSAKALSIGEDCMYASLKQEYAAGSNPFAARSDSRKPANPFAAPSDTRRAATARAPAPEARLDKGPPVVDVSFSVNFAETLLTSPPMAEALRYPVDEIDDEHMRVQGHAAWVVDESLCLILSTSVTVDLDPVEQKIFFADRKECEGAYASSSETIDLKDGRSARILKGACKSEDPIFVVYSFFPRRDGGMIRITHLASTPGAALDASDRSLDAMQGLLSKF